MVPPKSTALFSQNFCRRIRSRSATKLSALTSHLLLPFEEHWENSGYSSIKRGRKSVFKKKLEIIYFGWPNVEEKIYAIVQKRRKRGNTEKSIVCRKRFRVFFRIKISGYKSGHSFCKSVRTKHIIADNVE